MRLTASFLTAAALIVTLTPAVLADSFQYTVNSSVQESFTNAGNDSYMVYYFTPPDAFGTTSVLHSATPYYGSSPISNISFSVPAGNVITSAELELIVPSTTLQGILESLDILSSSPPDPGNPVHTSPLFDGGTSSFLVDGILGNGYEFPQSGQTEGDSTIFDLSNLLTIEGNDGYSSNLQELDLLGSGELNINVSSGYNWGGYVGGSGQVNIPYTLEVTGTYSPVPEPSSIVLLGSGILGLAGLARRKFLSQS